MQPGLAEVKIKRHAVNVCMYRKMPGGVKRHAVPASGYLYQTLVGIKLLCDWLDVPTRFAWVKFEADDTDATGLDDVIAERSDGLLELMQVKFTVDASSSENSLSWAWLMKRTGQRGKSLLEKWSTAAFLVGLDNIADVRLVTNRRPDSEFAGHVHDGKVQWSTLPHSLRDDVAKHFEGPEQASAFFNRFIFSHSYVGHEALARTLAQTIETRHADHYGWLSLHRAAVTWSIFKDQPSPDGRITLAVLRQTISEKLPRPLDQEFRVPAGYTPPNAAFAKRFLREILSGEWSSRVLWGSPGQGKSTFLSYICERLGAKKIRAVRHHYFLDLQDTSERLAFKSVAHSLMSQMESEFARIVAPLEKQPERLRDWLEVCAQACLNDGVRFVVVVDGLDHVWRENDGEISPLKELFAQLLPMPENATLILGSQRVSHEQLPPRLLQFVKSEDWVELPRMDFDSIQSWLRVQQPEGETPTNPSAYNAQGLHALTSAFHDVTDGHPLVLMYTYLKLSRAHRRLTPEVVQHVDLGPQGNALAYYVALWNTLSHSARDALHLIAEDKFVWPTDSLERCLGLKGISLESEIGHLLATVDAGLVAFHGSLYVFVSNRPEHADRIAELHGKVESWLVNEAPSYLRWAWLWLHQSSRGAHANLLSGTTKDWALDALVNAFEARQVIRILEAAEEAAFASGNYELAIQKRSLKHGVETGPTYQIDGAEILHGCALQLTKNPYPAMLLASNAGHLSIAELQQLALVLLSLGDTTRAVEVQGRMRDKINVAVRTGSMESGEYGDAIARFLDIAARTGKYEPKKVLRLLAAHSEPEDLFDNFLTHASGATDVAAAMAFVSIHKSARLNRVLECQAVRIAGWAGADLLEWDNFCEHARHPLVACWALLFGKQREVHLSRVISHPALRNEVRNDQEGEFARYLHGVFFTVVARCLRNGTASALSNLGIETERPWLALALDSLTTAAKATATILIRGDSPPASLVYRHVTLEKPTIGDHAGWSDFRTLRRALVLIAADTFLLTRRRSGSLHISEAEWAACTSSPLFAMEHWREAYLQRQYKLIEPLVARADISGQHASARLSVGLFNDKANELQDLCAWSTAYELEETATALLRDAYRYVIGYGWRKDPTLYRLLESVEDLVPLDANFALDAVHRLAPIYDRIDDMTEDSGSRPSDLADLLLRLRPDIYVRYYEHWLWAGEWYYADATLAAFAAKVDLEAAEATVPFAFLSGGHVDAALRSRLTVNSSSRIAQGVLLHDWNGSPSDEGRRGVGTLRDDGSRDRGLPDDAALIPNIEDYPPSQLADFLEALRDVGRLTDEREVLQEWFSHWESKRAGLKLLNAIRDVVNGDSARTRISDLLDPAFRLSLNLQGPAKAFPWLVLAHRHRYGWWEQYYGRKESDARLQLVGQHYRDRWQEFLSESTQPLPHASDQSRYIPREGLVRLLLAVGEPQRAKSVLLAMIESVIDGFECQPLTEPRWWQRGAV